MRNASAAPWWVGGGRTLLQDGTQDADPGPARPFPWKQIHLLFSCLGGGSAGGGGRARLARLGIAQPRCREAELMRSLLVPVMCGVCASAAWFQPHLRKIGNGMPDVKDLGQ